MMAMAIKFDSPAMTTNPSSVNVHASRRIIAIIRRTGGKMLIVQRMAKKMRNAETEIG